MESLTDYLEVFIRSDVFYVEKIKDGKVYCDICSKPFYAIHYFFIMVIRDEKKLICYPCNYKRIGINPYEKQKKELEEHIAALRKANNEFKDSVYTKKGKKKKKYNSQTKLF